MLCSRGADLLHLSTSFRAVPSLQSFVNAAFRPVMIGSPDASQAEYVPLEPYRAEITSRPTIVALPVPRPYGDYGKVVNFRIEESLPDAVGGFIDWLVSKSSWTVEEEDGQVVPVRPRHVCILFRRFKNFYTDVTRPYVRALEARRMPHVLVGGRSFHDREEILALRNALTAIEWPSDELRVYATLRGPLFASSDDALLTYGQYIDADDELRTRRFDPMRPVDRDQLDPSAHDAADALALLARLHVGRNQRPIAQTISMLLEAVRAHAGIAIWPTGEQALANCLRLIDLARRFERNGATSFRAFVERMEEEAESGEAADAPVVEEGTEGVRMMTVHRAKGLQFPVVVLADPTCPLNRSLPSRHVDSARELWLEPLCGSTPVELLEAAEEERRRDAAEAVRLTYVAATRARDLLIVPACGDSEIDGWLAPLTHALYPADDAKLNPSDAPGCPEFGEDSVLDRGEDGATPAGGSIRPGLHSPRAGAHQVVLWDPAKLDLDREEQVGLRQQTILEADDKGVNVAESKESYARWKARRAEAITRGGRASINVRTVTSLATEGVPPHAGEAELVGVEFAARADVPRPVGRRFGALVHAILATVSLDARPEAIAAVATVSGRLVDATAEEVAAAVTAVEAALAHPLLHRAAASAVGSLRRESPISLHRDDGTLVEGVVDLAFYEEAADFTGWTVVDFKTDREVEASKRQYLEQVALYVTAIKAATGLLARGFLLVVQ
jgi:ATP-dependent exoDNAse (exonuclease V) beta subunit